MHVPVALQKLATDCSVFELAKLRFRAHNYLYLMDFLKRANKMHNR